MPKIFAPFLALAFLMAPWKVCFAGKNAQEEMEPARSEEESSKRYQSRSSENKRAVLAVSPALTAGVGGGHAGVTLDVGTIGGSDVAGGGFLSLGIVDRSPDVYSAGVGVIAMGMGSGFYQADLRFQEGRWGGATLTGGIGLFSAFLIGRVGYDSFSHLPVAEVGATVKIPLVTAPY